MIDPTISCPKCKAEIKLTESLAAPLLESTRSKFAQQLAEKDAEIQQREAEIQSRESAIAKERAEIDQQVNAKLQTARAVIAAEEAKKAHIALADDIAQAKLEKSAVDELLQDRERKLAEARKNELILRQERQKLQEEKDQFELEKQRAIDAERTTIREAAQKDADEQARLKIAEKDKTITDLQAKLQDALRKAEQGSQQLQGEVLELELENILRGKFPRDTVEPVPKGQHGGDILQRVFGASASSCGTILWESKRTKNWSDGWLAKLREDQRTAKAEFAVIVSQTLPKSVDTFDYVEGIWLTCPRTVIPVAIALRHALIELAMVRTAGEGQKTKMEMLYQYLLGPHFRLRVQAIVEKVADLQEDLDKERKTMTKQWAKRAAQIQTIVESTAGMYGDLQGIAGQSLQEIEGLELKMLDGVGN